MPTPEGVLNTVASALDCTVEQARALLPDVPKGDILALRLVYEQAGAVGMRRLDEVRTENFVRNVFEYREES